MRLTRPSDCHLTYCTNIHPGESWHEVNHALRSCVPAVKERVCRDAPMGIGLRLSALAANELADNDILLREFQDWLRAQDLYVYTINGFPFGAFHGKRIKENVYRPDWAEPGRLRYSEQLAWLLARLLPAGLHGSISSVPVGFRPDFADENRMQRAVENLLTLVAYLAELEQDSGRLVQFALEPEPGCCLETARDTIAFFSQHLFTGDAVQRLAALLPAQLQYKADTALIRRHLGVCLDTCHAAVMFEGSLAVLMALQQAEVPVHKIQLTAALQVDSLTAQVRHQLARFADAVYLHQSSVRGHSTSSTQAFFLDLDAALAGAANGSELRCHFHVPVFVERLGQLSTTQADLVELLQALKTQSPCAHLEVETYTFDLLPMELREPSIVANISRELDWVKEQLLP